MGKGQVLEIVTVDGPRAAVLRRKAKPAGKVTLAVQRLIEDMVATMRAANGLGLAAPQVGEGKRVLVAEVAERLGTLVDPVLAPAEGGEVATEACLSIPGVLGPVRRAARVKVKGKNRRGRGVSVNAEGLLARVLQHEIDHLNGILFLDRVEDPATIERVGAEVQPAEVAAGGEGPEPPARPLHRHPRGPPAPPGGAPPAPPRVGVFARECSLPVMQPPSLRRPEVVRALAALDPDLLVTVAYGRIIPDDVLALPPLGAINAHPSLLPAYRGASPIQRAIADGQTETGVSIIYQTGELDAGDIILQERAAIGPEETAGELERRLADLSAILLLEGGGLSGEGRPPRRPQDPAAATYVGKLTKEDGRIDWQRPAEAIVNLVRAMDPWPSAYTFRAGRQVKTWRGGGGPGGAAPRRRGRGA